MPYDMKEATKMRALRRFNSKYGPLQPGEIFWCSDAAYADEQIRLGHIEYARDIEPSRRAVVPQAPSVGKDLATRDPLPPSPAESTPAAEPTPGDGPAPRSSVSRRGRRLPRPT